MIIERDDDRLLFLRYALPCASTLVKRGNVTKEYIDGLVDQVSKGMVPKGNAESIFKVANVMCDRLAAEMSKSSTDAEVIRRYFLFEHTKVVKDRFELMRDFNPTDCKTYAGRVSKIDGNRALVDTVLGQKSYRTNFVENLKENESVVVHYDYVIERISEEVAEKKNKLGE